MTYQTKPEDFAEAAKMAEAAGLWHLAAANWGMAIKATSRPHPTTQHTIKENTNA